MLKPQEVSVKDNVSAKVKLKKIITTALETISVLKGTKTSDNDKVAQELI